MKRFRCQIEEWSGAPQMNTGAPMPAICLRDDRLFVAYLVANPEPDDFDKRFAVVRFEGVLQHTFGYPNDEALGGHPLYSKGLDFYAFNEVTRSPYLRELGKRNAKTFPGTSSHFTEYRHWIVTFHDETLEIVGESVSFLGAAAASSAREAIASHAP